MESLFGLAWNRCSAWRGLRTLSEAEIEELWLEESLRRHQEVVSGVVETESLDEALAKARATRR